MILLILNHFTTPLLNLFLIERPHSFEVLIVLKLEQMSDLTTELPKFKNSGLYCMYNTYNEPTSLFQSERQSMFSS